MNTRDKTRDNTLNNFLSESPLFAHLPPETIATLIPYLNYQKYSKDQILFSEGTKGEVMYLIMKGEFITTVKSEKQHVEVARFKGGDFLGELSFFDQQPRSATCKASKESEIVAFTHEAYQAIEGEYPAICAQLLLNILSIINDRLRNSDIFLSDMVLWGKEARTRSITDEATALFNRRYFDTVLSERILDAKLNGLSFMLIIIDIDHFGKINQMVGDEEADKAILSLANILKDVNNESFTAFRYGGDEFAIIYNGSSHMALRDAKTIGSRFAHETHIVDKKGAECPLTISVGISCYPDHAYTQEVLIQKADEALYASKKAGRNTVSIYQKGNSLEPKRKMAFKPIPTNTCKKALASLAIRNQIINNVIHSLVHRNSFLILGHKEADDDCIAAATAIALIIKKFNKHVQLMIHYSPNQIHSILQKMCQYNSIPILPSAQTQLTSIDTIIICDSPRPDMIDGTIAVEHLLADDSILNIEIDHHLGANSRYAGNKDYCLVDNATSTCELVYTLAYKLETLSTLLKRHSIDSILGRNVVMSLIIGILGDTQHGQYVHGVRNQRIYQLYTNSLNTRLADITYQKNNIRNARDIMNITSQTKKAEREIEDYLLKRMVTGQYYNAIVINAAESVYLWNTFDTTAIPTVVRSLVNQLAEENGYIGEVIYDDLVITNTNKSNRVLHGHVRRSAKFKALDLRAVLKHAGILDGGGHEGAVGFHVRYTTEEQRTNIINTWHTSITNAVSKRQKQVDT